MVNSISQSPAVWQGIMHISARAWQEDCAAGFLLSVDWSMFAEESKNLLPNRNGERFFVCKQRGVSGSVKDTADCRFLWEKYGRMMRSVCDEKTLVSWLSTEKLT